MKYWSHVVVEGHCFGKEDSDGNNPCGNEVPSQFCLGNGMKERCPYFAWTNSNEREAAHFVPFYLILKDKINIWTEKAWQKLSWWLWDRLPFNQEKTRKFFENIKIADKDSPDVKIWDNMQQQAQDEFKEWYINAKQYSDK